MSVHPIVDVAWKVDSMLSDDKVRARFLAKCREFLKLKEDKNWQSPLPFPGDPDEQFELDEKRDVARFTPELLLGEQYAILAALHEAKLPNRPIVDPIPLLVSAETNEIISPMFRHSLAWAALVSKAKDLKPTNHQLRNLEACLAAVKSDLGKWLANESTNNVATNTTQRQTQAGPVPASASETPQTETKRAEHPFPTAPQTGADTPGTIPSMPEGTRAPAVPPTAPPSVNVGTSTSKPSKTLTASAALDKPKRHGPTVNQCFAELLQANPTDVGLSAEKWADRIAAKLKRRVTASAVKQTATWKGSVKGARALVEAKKKTGQ